jgi:hypothetical protein
MTEVHDFVALFARARKSRKLVHAAYGDSSLSINQINCIIKASGQCHSNAKKNEQTDDVVAAVAALIKNQRMMIRELATMLDMAFVTIQLTLTVDLGLVRKSSHWLPKLLSSAFKRRGSSAARTSSAPSVEVLGGPEQHCHHGRVPISFHTFETKRWSHAVG